MKSVATQFSFFTPHLFAFMPIQAWVALASKRRGRFGEPAPPPTLVFKDTSATNDCGKGPSPTFALSGPYQVPFSSEGVMFDS